MQRHILTAGTVTSPGVSETLVLVDINVSLKGARLRENE